MLHPVTLLEAVKGKCLTFLSDQPDLLDGRCRSSAPAAAEEAIADQLDPPIEAAVQLVAQVHPAAEI